MPTLTCFSGRKTQKSNHNNSNIKPRIEEMTTFLKLQELLIGTNPKRIKPLTDSVYNDISNIRNLETLFSEPILSALKLCWEQQYGPLSKFWHRCENKIIQLINNPLQTFYQPITDHFPSPNILKYLP